jgi:hypothetical protein
MGVRVRRFRGAKAASVVVAGAIAVTHGLRGRASSPVGRNWGTRDSRWARDGLTHLPKYFARVLALAPRFGQIYTLTVESGRILRFFRKHRPKKSRDAEVVAKKPVDPARIKAASD